jgi:sugar lactone lactonase YvrE
MTLLSNGVADFLTSDGAGNLYYAGEKGITKRVIATGEVTVLASDVYNIQGLTFAQGAVYVTSWFEGVIKRISAGTSEPVAGAQPSPASDHGMAAPCAVATDEQGNVYAGVHQGGRAILRAIAPDGQMRTLVPLDDYESQHCSLAYAHHALYWATGDDTRGIRRIELTSGAITVLDGTVGTYGHSLVWDLLAVEGDALYCRGNYELRRISLA